ncbi:MAG: hypothetical protein ABI425_03080 [Patescibacteria group bacterium]
MLIAATQDVSIGQFQGAGTGVFDPTITGACNSLEGIISLILGFLTVLAGLAFLLYFLFGALQWTLAGGDEGKVETAKKQMTNGAIGLIIVIISYGIMAVIGGALGLDLLAPGTAINALNPLSTTPCKL